MLPSPRTSRLRRPWRLGFVRSARTKLDARSSSRHRGRRRGAGRGARCFRRAGRPGLVMAMALLRATVGLLSMATRRRSRDTATGRREATRRLNRAMRRRASASRRRASRATSSCRRARRRARRRVTEVRLRTGAADHHLLTRLTPSRAARRRPTRPTLSRVGKARSRRTRLTHNSKRRRRSSTAVLLRATVALLRATEARRLSNTAVRLLSRVTVRLRANRSMALPKDSTAPLRAALRPRDNRMALRRRPNNHHHTTARPPTRLGPTVRRRDLRDHRTEFMRLLFRRSLRPIEISCDETLRDERRPDNTET